MTNWNDHFQRYNGALAWMPRGAAGYLADYQQLSSWGIDYFPHVWPGFSWAQLQRLTDETQYTPRGGGLFYWQNIHTMLGNRPLSPALPSEAEMGNQRNRLQSP